MLKKNVPNLLTISRALAIPAIILSFYIENKYAGLITISIFVFACITDFFVWLPGACVESPIKVWQAI